MVKVAFMSILTTILIGCSNHISIDKDNTGRPELPVLNLKSDSTDNQKILAYKESLNILNYYSIKLEHKVNTLERMLDSKCKGDN